MRVAAPTSERTQIGIWRVRRASALLFLVGIIVLSFESLSTEQKQPGEVRLSGKVLRPILLGIGNVLPASSTPRPTSAPTGFRPVWERWPKNANLTKVVPVPKQVFVLWFGRPMAGARLSCFNELKDRIGVPLQVVTDENIGSFNVSTDPIHPAIFAGQLSMNHRVDYLRAYMMHHHGGGYHDVKPPGRSWSTVFDVYEDPHVWAKGFNELDIRHIGCSPKYASLMGLECGEVKSHWAKLISNGAFTVRPQTPLTHAWMSMLNANLDEKWEALRAHPAPNQRCCITPEDMATGYPFKWAELGGEVVR
mmetsp:Transcript_98853/g.282629  ORF Transcript_98853/g.282629 Transcript_98853/m.282629 type:complete len:307 (+) Transcript_98853:73-993(+)